MADRIITVTDPSVVTNDTLAGYNNYSDIDGQLGTTMTPAEATNGHTVVLSDGEVHQVTTKPVGTINGEFSSVVSNSVEVDVSGPTILFEDDFTGTTIDAGKWAETVDTPSSFDITQNNDLIMEGKGTTTQTTFSQHLTGQSAIDITTMKVVAFDIKATNQNDGKWGVGITADADLSDNLNKMVVQSTGTIAGDIIWFIKIGGSTVTQYSHTIDMSTTQSFKILLFDSGEIKFRVWNGSIWQGFSSTTLSPTGNWKPVIGGSDVSGVLNTTNVDNYVITDEDYATLRP